MTDEPTSALTPGQKASNPLVEYVRSVMDGLCPPPTPGTLEANDLVIRGSDGDPTARGTRMIEKESSERVVEGLKIAADRAMHLSRYEPEHNQTWRDVGKRLDEIRLQAVKLAADDLPMKQCETETRISGAPLGWRQARNEFLDGLRQATGGMRQLATCFRADFRWSLLAQELENGDRFFRALLRGKPEQGRGKKSLILPPGFVRQS